MLTLPYSEACERNKEPILEVLRGIFVHPGHVLEIGSGTGQHAVHFAAQLAHLQWQTSDLPENLPGLRARLEAAGLPNLPPPLELDVQADWPQIAVEGAYSANTAHIMSWEAVQAMFRGVQRIVVGGGHFCLYGPFNDGGRYTSASNAAFDRALRAQDPRMGLRDAQALQELAAEMTLIGDHPMPANNRLLVWRRQDPAGP
jgi:hypothetical protein